MFDLIDFFAGYGFNRSHSAAYALITYRTAYLKANYPVEFMTALLTSERDNTDKVVEYVKECGAMGIKFCLRMLITALPNLPLRIKMPSVMACWLSRISVPGPLNP